MAKLAESEPLTWETLISQAPNAAEKSQFEALRQKTAGAIAAASTDDDDSADEPDAKEPSAAPARSDVDDLPGARAADPHAYAVVIGVEHYREKLPNADFSAADANLAAEYFKRVLGVPEENLALLSEEHASKSDFEKYFERWLPNRVEAGDTVYVYYSGHGAPNPAKGDSYLVPYDGDPAYLEQTGYSLKRLFDQLGFLPARQVYVAMDSCFSGAGGRSVIARGERPLASVVEDLGAPGEWPDGADLGVGRESGQQRRRGKGARAVHLLLPQGAEGKRPGPARGLRLSEARGRSRGPARGQRRPGAAVEAGPMKLARVVGRVFCSRQDPAVDKKTLLLIQPLRWEDESPLGDPIVAADAVGAGSSGKFLLGRVARRGRGVSRRAAR